MHEYGTIGIIRQMARAPQAINIIVEGMARARVGTTARRRRRAARARS